MKYNFFKPPQKKILLFDKNSNIFFNYLKKNEFSLLNLETEINIFVLLRLIFKFKRINLINYYIEYIKICSPKVLITFIDNNILFYKFKKHFPKIYFVSVQNGIRTKYFFQKLNKEKDLKCDYILTWGSNIAAEYRKFIKCKTLAIGSFNNNRHTIRRAKKRKSIVLIASKYRREGEKVYISRPNFFLSRETLFKTEKAILPRIFAVCQKFNRNFEIVSKTIREKVQEEKKFYEDILKSKNFKFHIRGESKNIYDISDSVELCLNTSSSFGLECIRRGNKICFLNIRNQNKIIRNLKVFWPGNYQANGSFWINDIKNGKLEKMIENVLFSPNSAFKKSKKKIIQGLISYDKDNRIFQNLIVKLTS
jgi:surface carbohydrate biosynthesis protein